MELQAGTWLLCSGPSPMRIITVIATTVTGPAYTSMTRHNTFVHGTQGNPDLKPLIGLAWDCGGVVTGPVTVPILLALGIGVATGMRQKRSSQVRLISGARPFGGGSVPRSKGHALHNMKHLGWWSAEIWDRESNLFICPCISSLILQHRGPIDNAI